MAKGAKCRGCGIELIGKPYHLGGDAYIPKTMERCRVNHYGGYVCSEQCDRSVCMSVLRSMPQCGDAERPDCFAAQSLRDNWA